MPLLPNETYVYPDDLLAEQGGPPAEGAWWVVHARPRAEKALARALLEQQAPFFLPLYQKRWWKSGRQFSSFLPLFPGYLFVVGGDSVRGELLATNQVVNLLPVPDQAKLHADLTRLFRLVQVGTSLLPEAGMEPGTPVVIVCGPLAGLEGTLLRRGNSHRLLVEISFLNQAASVELDEEMVRRTDARSGADCRMASVG
jgi:transcriptional antiterminator RfaH